MTTDEKLDLLLNEFTSFKDEFTSFKSEVDSLKGEVTSFKSETNSLREEVNSLKETVNHNTVVTETLVSKCVQVIGESISMNAERFDRVDFDSIKRNYEVAVLYAQTVKEQVDSLAKKIDNIA